MDLQVATINGRKVIALTCVLDALTKADAELKKLGIGYKGTLGFVLSDETTGGWRSLALQTQLKARGASKTLNSNHRHGSAVDCAADWGYIKAIAPTMKKYGLINDLAYIKGNKTSDQPFPGAVAWDGGHFNFGSNAKANAFPTIDVLPALLTEYSMQKYEGQIINLSEAGYPGLSGSFAFVQDGKKRVIQDKSRGWKALATLDVRKTGNGLTKAQWDAVPTGEDF